LRWKLIFSAGYKSFTEWNADPEVVKTAEELYGHIDKLELYPGLHAEGRNGDGFNVQYPKLRVDTMRNGLLFDAIALVSRQTLHLPSVGC
jgi:hypothetical protein